MSTIPVITIDGFAASGKGTIAYRLAQSLAWNYLDSGAIYRSAGWMVYNNEVPLFEADVMDFLQKFDLQFEMPKADDPVIVRANGVDISEQIRGLEAAQTASKIAAMQEVRTRLLQLQHSFRQAPGLVTDGRDMGTVIFPDAQVKIFLTASLEARAERRFAQLQAQGNNANLAAIRDELHERDERDKQRAVAPTVPAADAVILDSSEMDADQTFAAVVKIVNQSGVNG